MNLEDFPEVPAHVRMIIWLGLEKHQEDWTNREQTEGDFCVYAETVRQCSPLAYYSCFVGGHGLFPWFVNYSDSSTLCKTFVLTDDNSPCVLYLPMIRTTLMSAAPSLPGCSQQIALTRP